MAASARAGEFQNIPFLDSSYLRLTSAKLVINSCKILKLIIIVT